jgi:BirA family biotin operon repressor/biotin-[acetyl-CoA-carboxylase] ligase
MTTDHWRTPLDESALRAILPSPPWRRVDVVAETGSTNADLIARAAAGEDVDGSVLIAEHQTAGRGRNGRSWSAVPGTQVTMSVGVSAEGIPGRAWGWIPLIAGLAVIDAVGAASGVDPGLKWPNDVLARPPAHGKLAGILAEVAAPAPLIVLGVGLNVSLRAAQGADAALMAEYTAHSVTIGARVRAVLPGDREIVGDARSVDDQGRLCIDSGGETVVVSAGDIVHLRPVGGSGTG